MILFHLIASILGFYIYILNFVIKLETPPQPPTVFLYLDFTMPFEFGVFQVTLVCKTPVIHV